MNQKAGNRTDKVHNGKRHVGSRVVGLGLIFLFICGLLIAVYPIVSNALAQRNTIRGIEAYQVYSANLSAKELESAWDAARVYNDNLAGEPVRDPFMADSGMALPENYKEVLNPAADGIMGYLEVPAVDIRLMIAHGTDSEVLEQDSGHIEQTSLPIGGASSHAVLTAHTGLSTARLFTDLINVKIGDKFYIYVLDEQLSYQVDQIEVVLPEAVELLRIVPEEDYVTLLTCTPYGINSHRLLVRGVRIPNEETVETAKEKHMHPLWLLLGALLLPILFWWRRWRKKKISEERNVQRHEDITQICITDRISDWSGNPCLSNN